MLVAVYWFHLMFSLWKDFRMCLDDYNILMINFSEYFSRALGQIF